MYLVDMLLASPSEAAGVVTAEHQQWRMVGVRIRREYGRSPCRLVSVGAGSYRVQYN